MEALDVYHQYGEELERGLRLASLPLAIKLLKTEEDIPEEAQRPIRDTDHHLSLCQALQMSRVNGKPVAMKKEDMWCFEPVISLGLAEPPQSFLDGHFGKGDSESIEANAFWARSAPRFKVGSYVGIASAPLSTANFEPDAVMIYCNPFRCRQLLQLARWKDGRDVTARLCGHAGTCLNTFVPAVQTGEYQVAIPCHADIYEARCGDDQVIFTVPEGKLASFMSGFRHYAQRGAVRPLAHRPRPEYPLPESFMRMGKELGYM